MHVETRPVATPSSMTGLRCQWVATEDEKGVHLVAHWSHERTENGDAAISADLRVGPKEGETCWHTTLYFVWGSH